MKTSIIDLDSILFAAAWGEKIPDGQGDYLRDEKGRLIYKDKTEEQIGESIDFIMNTILSETNSDSYIAYVKGIKTGQHRYQAKPDYKCNRPKESPKWWDFAKSYIINNWNAIPVDNIEVDDAVNITRLKIPNSFIVAIDKDLLNLYGIHYNWKTKEWIAVNKKDEAIFFWSDMITGQTGDGITGIPGKGKAYVRKLLVNNIRESKTLHSLVLDEYINYYGESKGIEEFYKNYTCLKILENDENFTIPQPIRYKVVEKSIFDEI